MNWGQEVFFPTNADLADILGDMDLNFENFRFWYFLWPNPPGLGLGQLAQLWHADLLAVCTSGAKLMLHKLAGPPAVTSGPLNRTGCRGSEVQFEPATQVQFDP